jgi:hypothetical protein
MLVKVQQAQPPRLSLNVHSSSLSLQPIPTNRELLAATEHMTWHHQVVTSQFPPIVAVNVVTEQCVEFVNNMSSDDHRLHCHVTIDTYVTDLSTFYILMNNGIQSV